MPCSVLSNSGNRLGRRSLLVLTLIMMLQLPLSV